MSALGDLLELLHEAGDLAGAARLTVLEWNHLPRMREAFGLAASGSTATVTFAGSPRLAPETTSCTNRLFWRSRDVLREESAGAQEGRRVLVRDGSKWVSWDADWGVASGTESASEQGPAPQLAFLVDPAELLGALRFEPRDRVTAAGREAILVRAFPRGSGGSGTIALHRLGWGAESFELAVDAERGTLLRVEARTPKGPFHRFEVTEIAFLEGLPPETFTFDPPAGEEALQGLRAKPEWVDLDVAARRAEFVVLVPSRVPVGWRLGTMLVPGRERSGDETSVHLSYTSPDGAYGAQLAERAAGGADDDWLVYERRGGLEVADAGSDVDPRWHVRLTEHGTLVELSGSGSLELLVGLAESLVPAPTEPPRLLG